MQFDHLRILEAVASHKSMSKAAAALFCTQPAVSAAIKSIETELGYPVVERTADGVRPTEFGMMVIDDAQMILDTYDRWKSLARHESSNQPIVIVMTGTAPTFNIVSAIQKTQSLNPDLKIDIKFKHEPNAATSHINGRIGIQYKTPAHIQETAEYARANGLMLALLQKDEFVVLANSKNPIAQKEEVALEDIRNQRVLLYQNPLRFPYIDKLSEAGISCPSQMFNSTNLMVAVSLMRDAITIRPSKTLLHNPFVDYGDVKALPFEKHDMPVNLYVSFPIRKRLFESERLFLDNLRKCFPLFEEVALD